MREIQDTVRVVCARPRREVATDAGKTDGHLPHRSFTHQRAEMAALALVAAHDGQH
jgi:hypothetical protein